MTRPGNEPRQPIRTTEQNEQDNRSIGGQLYWILPVATATFALTIWLLVNPRLGSDIAAIITIPINVAAVLVPVLLSLSTRSVPNWGRRKARKLRVATAISAVALLLTGGFYLFTREPNPEDYLSGTVRVGVNSEDYPGWDETVNNRRKGFDVALVEFLARYFDFEPDYIPLSRKDRTDNLAREEGDGVKLVVANFSITPGREDLIDFAGPYFIDQQGFFTWDENARTLEDIPHGKICVPADTTAEERLDQYDMEPEREESLVRCVQRLLDNEDPTLAVSTDAAIVEAYAASKGQTAPSSIVVGSENYGVGIPNNRPKLCGALNRAIDEFLSYHWENAFREHLGTLSPDGRKPDSTRECRTPASFLAVSDGLPPGGQAPPRTAMVLSTGRSRPPRGTAVSRRR